MADDTTDDTRGEELQRLHNLGEQSASEGKEFEPYHGSLSRLWSDTERKDEDNEAFRSGFENTKKQQSQ